VPPSYELPKETAVLRMFLRNMDTKKKSGKPSAVAVLNNDFMAADQWLKKYDDGRIEPFDPAAWLETEGGEALGGGGAGGMAEAAAAGDSSASAAMVVQKRLWPPPIEGHVWELGVFVLITSVNPLRAYWHEEALPRLSLRACAGEDGGGGNDTAAARAAAGYDLSAEEFRDCFVVTDEMHLPFWKEPTLAALGSEKRLSPVQALRGYLKDKGECTESVSFLSRCLATLLLINVIILFLRLCFEIHYTHRVVIFRFFYLLLLAPTKLHVQAWTPPG
jgi:hypothetical protein